MVPKVLITQPIPQEVEGLLAQRCNIKIWTSERRIPREYLLAELSEVSGLLTARERIDKELLEVASELRIVSNISANYDNFDIPAMRQANVFGTYTPYVADDTFVDLLFALMLAAARRVPELDRMVKNGGWTGERHDEWLGSDVHHAVLGIVGLGRIGEALARRAQLGFHMEVLYHDTMPRTRLDKEWGLEYCTLDELLSRADFVVFLLPSSPHTPVFGWQQLSLMKPEAIFISAGGAAVDEAALARALQMGVIRAAALDFQKLEITDAGKRLCALPNVIALPHIADETTKTRLEMTMLAAHNLMSGLQGNPPTYLVPELRDLGRR